MYNIFKKIIKYYLNINYYILQIYQQNQKFNLFINNKKVIYLLFNFNRQLKLLTLQLIINLKKTLKVKDIKVI